MQLRGDSLLRQAKASIDKLQASGNIDLGSHLQYEMVKAEMLITDFKQMNHISRFQLHAFEEELFKYENSISDEIYIIDEVQQEKERGQTVGQLIARADGLIKKIQQASTQHANISDGKGIRHEGYIVQSVANQLKASNPSQAELRNAELQLLRIEKTLDYLLEKANLRNPTRPPFHPPQ